MSHEHPSPSSERFRAGVLLALLFALQALAYLPAFSGELLFDDVPLLQYQDCWRGLDRIPAMFSFDEANACTYRPVRYATYALDYAIGGFDPTFLHVSNFIYHLLLTLAVFRLFGRWSSPIPAAWMAGLWSAHPVLTDAVAYISGRRDIVSTLFFVLALLPLIRPAEKPVRPRHYLAAALFYGLAIGAKEMAVTLPVLWVWFLVVQGWGRRGQWLGALRRRAGVIAAGLACAGVFTLYRGFWASHSAMAGHWWGGSIRANFATSFALLLRYAKLVLWPADLIGDYHERTIPLAAGFTDWRSVAGILIVCSLLGVIGVSLRRGWTASALGVGWFCLTLIPVIHIFPHHELFAEHYLVLPLIGVMLALLPAVQRLHHSPGRRQRILLWTLLVVVAATMLGRTFVRCQDWKTEQSFYQAAYRLAPDNQRVRFYLGILHAEKGDCAQAVPHLEAVVRSSAVGSVMAREAAVAHLMCSVLSRRHQVAEQEADHLAAIYGGDPRVFYWRGRARLEQGRYGEAIGDLKRALALTGGESQSTVHTLVMSMNLTGRHEQALAVLDRYADRGEPFLCEQEILALAGLGASAADRAVERFYQCRDQFPDSLVLLEWNAVLAIQSGRTQEAEQALTRLRELGAGAEVFSRIERRRQEILPVIPQR